ncbi:MAG: phytoene/squalene synthase family protein, partial [Polyangiales bacterium]
PGDGAGGRVMSAMATTGARAGTAIARRTIAQHSKSFALASKLLPAACRDDVVVLYAWCRRADDAIDLAAPGDRETALVRLREELESVYRGQRQPDDVLHELQRVIVERGIPRIYPEELLAGMEMDVVGTRYESMDVLLQYCFRVAGVVGLMMCHVMGVRDAHAVRHAAHLGMAMQLTNICRDVREDWEQHGRLYLPEDLLAAHGPRGTVAALVDESERYYRSGDAGLSSLSFRCAFAVCTARLVYAAIGERLARRRFDVTRGRVVVPSLVKLYLVVKAFFLTTARISARPSLPRIERVLRFPHDVLPI